MLAQALGEAGVVVVSGLARGIDSAAHDGALATGTIAVIAGGIDVVYPPENEARQAAVASQGLLVAEQPPGTEPRARHFPYRNRIIAGLAHGTIVVEAAPKSGSLITARCATEFGREVMAVPGSPLDPRAEGANDLIRNGATLCGSAEHVTGVLGPLIGADLQAKSEAREPLFRAYDEPLWDELDLPETVPLHQAKDSPVAGEDGDAFDVGDDRSRLAQLLGPSPSRSTNWRGSRDCRSEQFT